MNDVELLQEDIEKLRKNLYDLITAKESDFLDPEVIAASQILNATITKYNEIISKYTNK